MTISTRRLRILRGNSSAIAGFTGLQGELVFNTDTYTLHLQDGATAGGFSLATSAELANITANANYGNSNVSSYLASNSNVTILTTGNITVGNAELSTSGNSFSVLTGARGAGNTSIRISANTLRDGIYIRNDNGAMGFNTVPSGPNIGYEFTFNGSVYATEFYTEANMPTGYQFNTTDGDTGLSHVNYSANLNAIRIRHAGVETVKFYNNNTTEMKGNIVVSDGVSYGTFPNAYMQIYGNVNSYQQVVNQNLSTNAAASTDFVATADNGTDSTYFIDMGINSSQFNQASWFPAANTKNDGYLYVVGTNAVGPSNGNIANLIIGSTNGLVKTFVGNTSDANVVTTVSTNLLTVSGNVNASYFIGNGSLLTGITAGTNYSNTNVAAYLTVYNGAILTNTINFSDSTVQTTAWKAGGNSAFSSNSIFVNNVAAGNFNNNGDFNVVFDAYTGGPTLNLSASYQSPLNSNVGVTVQAVNTPIVMSNANIELRSNLATTWTFDTNGAINLANHGVIRRQDSVNLVGNGYVQMQWVDTGNLNIADPNGTSGPTNWMWVDQTGLHIETNVNSGGTSYAWEFLNTGNIGATGNIRLVTNDNLWNFDTNGSLTFPGNTLQIGLVGGNSGIRSDSANIVIDTTAAGGGQWNFISNGKLQSPNGGLIGAVDTNDVNSFGLKAGGSVNYVELNYGDDQRIYVDSAGSYIGTNNQSSQYLWSFRDDGWLTLPGSLSTTGNITGANVVSANTFVSNAFNVVTAGNLLITSQYGLGFTGTILEDNGTLELIANGAGGVVVGWDSTYGNGLGNIATVNFNEVGGGEGNILLRTGNRSATEYNWIFDKLGTLTLPGSLSTPSNITVNDTLFVVGSIQPTGASPAPYLSGFSSISTVISGNANEGNITAHNYLRANGGIITTGNITGGNLSISGNMTGNTAGFVIGYRDIPQVVFTSNATLALTDAGKHYYSANSANIITVPNNATVSFNIGTAISIVQQGTANLTVTPASGVTMYLAGNSTSASRTLGNYGMATLMKVATDTWFINGTGLT